MELRSYLSLLSLINSQCLRRSVEEKDPMQGFNGLKYLSTIVALVMRTVYDLKKGMFWKIMAASSSGVTTIFSTYWDIVIDWGLLQRNAKNPWLRDKLLVSNKAVYFVAIVSFTISFIKHLTFIFFDRLMTCLVGRIGQYSKKS